MSKTILDNLFGSRVRVKLLKLLFRQHPLSFTMSELVLRVQEPAFIARRELTILQGIGLVKKAKDRFGLNEHFELSEELRNLVLKPLVVETDRLIKRVNSVGRVKLAVVAGIFVSNSPDLTYETPADLFIVGDDIDKGKLTKFIKLLESEMGTEVRFGVMEKDEFKYRYDMFDRFLRVLLEGPHRKIINKLDIQ